MDGEKRTNAEAQGIGDEGLKLNKAAPVTNGGSGSLPTVRIKHPDHPKGLIINESDFNPKKQKLFDEPDEDEDDEGDEGAGDGGGDEDPSKGGSGAGAPAGGGNTPAGDKGGSGPAKKGGKAGAKGKGK